VLKCDTMCVISAVYMCAILFSDCCSVLQCVAEFWKCVAMCAIGAMRMCAVLFK